MGEEIGFSEQSNGRSIDRFLILLYEDILAHDLLPTSGEPQIDYTMSYILTFDEYMASLEAKLARKQALLKEAKVCKIAAKENKEKWKLQKLEKLYKTKEWFVERATIICEKDYWEPVKRNRWSYKLHKFVKAST